VTGNIPLTQNCVTIVDDEDMDLIRYRWHVKRESKTSYAARNMPGTYGKVTVRMHREIIERVLNRQLQNGEIVDHVNRDGLDNRRANLRICNHAQNLCNTQAPTNNSSGYKGVSFKKPTQKWQASIGYNGKKHFLGYYETALEAHEAYTEAAKTLFGEFVPTTKRLKKDGDEA